MHSFIQKTILSSYRTISNIVLAFLIGGVIWFLVLLLFYMLNNNWAAPIEISRTHPKILQLNASMFQAQQQADILKLEISEATQELAVIDKEQKELEQLINASEQSAIKLAHLNQEKKTDTTHNKTLVAKVNQVETSLDDNLKAGIITKIDALNAKIKLNGIKSSTIDAVISSELLDHQMVNKNRLELLEAKSKILRIDLKRAQDTEVIAAKKNQLEQINKIIQTLSDSPYISVTHSESPLHFAFVPYGTLDSATKVGEPVYDCLLHNFICRNVGKVVKLNRDEEVAQHPLFKIDTRGVLVQIELTDESSATSRVVFIGHKPLLF
ncbi:hypothetical protein [Hydromonas duriensis]|uniref:Uncharacterized protein n=1 Tax=Hydromonas duriensis TaxID=1527608 RepID=A0A4R6Y7F5_9BURK|nr:hypothetical protein [Hydromonas duriensis]TDR31262.1 hypothetical protein DFR44_11125 [Hydromonas duriensis]